MSYSPSYPIGRFEIPTTISEAHRHDWIQSIDRLPSLLADLVAHLNEESLEKQYREESWNIKEIVHHLADSHMNGFIRHKLALTENNPTIKGYEQDGWALLPDVARVDIKQSLSILEGVHNRWTVLLLTLSNKQWQRTYYHPEWKHSFTLAESLAQYAWHGKHHMEHIKIALEKTIFHP